MSSELSASTKAYDFSSSWFISQINSYDMLKKFVSQKNNLAGSLTLIKVFRSISKHVLCHIKTFSMRKNVLLKIVRLIYKFSNPQNPSIKRQSTIAYFLVFTNN